MYRTSEKTSLSRKMAELEDRWRKNQEDRYVLELKFKEVLKGLADKHEEAKLLKLREKYYHFLENEDRRNERNDQILRTLDKIESQANMIAAKTERLRLLKLHYEAYMKRMYTEWEATRHYDREEFSPNQNEASFPSHRKQEKGNITHRLPRNEENMNTMLPNHYIHRNEKPFCSMKNAVDDRDFEKFRVNHEPSQNKVSYRGNDGKNRIMNLSRELAKMDINSEEKSGNSCAKSNDLEENTSKDLLNVSLSDDIPVNDATIPVEIEKYRGNAGNGMSPSYLKGKGDVPEVYQTFKINENIEYRNCDTETSNVTFDNKAKESVFNDDIEFKDDKNIANITRLRIQDGKNRLESFFDRESGVSDSSFHAEVNGRRKVGDECIKEYKPSVVITQPTPDIGKSSSEEDLSQKIMPENPDKYRNRRYLSSHETSEVEVSEGEHFGSESSDHLQNVKHDGKESQRPMTALDNKGDDTFQLSSSDADIEELERQMAAMVERKRNDKSVEKVLGDDSFEKKTKNEYKKDYKNVFTEESDCKQTQNLSDSLEEGDSQLNKNKPDINEMSLEGHNLAYKSIDATGNKEQDQKIIREENKASNDIYSDNSQDALSYDKEQEPKANLKPFLSRKDLKSDDSERDIEAGGSSVDVNSEILDEDQNINSNINVHHPVEYEVQDDKKYDFSDQENEHPVEYEIQDDGKSDISDHDNNPLKYEVQGNKKTENLSVHENLSVTIQNEELDNSQVEGPIQYDNTERGKRDELYEEEYENTKKTENHKIKDSERNESKLENKNYFRDVSREEHITEQEDERENENEEYYDRGKNEVEHYTEGQDRQVEYAEYQDEDSKEIDENEDYKDESNREADVIAHDRYEVREEDKSKEESEQEAWEGSERRQSTSQKDNEYEEEEEDVISEQHKESGKYVEEVGDETYAEESFVESKRQEEHFSKNEAVEKVREEDKYDPAEELEEEERYERSDNEGGEYERSDFTEEGDEYEKQVAVKDEGEREYGLNVAKEEDDNVYERDDVIEEEEEEESERQIEEERVRQYVRDESIREEDDVYEKEDILQKPQNQRSEPEAYNLEDYDNQELVQGEYHESEKETEEENGIQGFYESDNDEKLLEEKEEYREEAGHKYEIEREDTIQMKQDEGVIYEEEEPFEPRAEDKTLYQHQEYEEESPADTYLGQEYKVGIKDSNEEEEPIEPKAEGEIVYQRQEYEEESPMDMNVEQEYKTVVKDNNEEEEPIEPKVEDEIVYQHQEYEEESPINMNVEQEYKMGVKDSNKQQVVGEAKEVLKSKEVVSVKERIIQDDEKKRSIESRQKDNVENKAQNIKHEEIQPVKTMKDVPDTSSKTNSVKKESSSSEVKDVIKEEMQKEKKESARKETEPTMTSSQSTEKPERSVKENPSASGRQATRQYGKKEYDPNKVEKLKSTIRKFQLKKDSRMDKPGRKPADSKK